jgi:hypothetical protein
VGELQAHFDEFRIVLQKHIRELRTADPEDQSTAWYLLKYLLRIHKKVVISTSPREVENTIRALLRYYLDAIDEGSNLEERIKEILMFYHRSLRLERRD